MKSPKKVGIVIILMIIVVVFIRLVGSEINYVTSSLDKTEYLVRNLDDSLQAANMLAQIRQNIGILVDHLNEYIDRYPDYEEYIVQLSERIPGAVISESSDDSQYTSYSVNKGEEIVFCLRSREDQNRLHSLNLVMYVALHELAHVACPEFGHTPLFKKIFAFLAQRGIELGLYRKIDFNSRPAEYCGLMINDSVV